MFLQFPEDRTTHYLDRQYMLGPSILVAPVFSPSSEETEYYLPAGVWTSFGSANQRTVTGPVWIKEVVPLDEIPIWIRSRTVLLLGPEGVGRPDYDYSSNIHVHVFGLGDEESAEATVPNSKIGETSTVIKAEKRGGVVRVFVSQGDAHIAEARVTESDGALHKTSKNDQAEFVCNLT